jgi:hypothetical protein
MSAAVFMTPVSMVASKGKSGAAALMVLGLLLVLALAANNNQTARNQTV